MAKRIRIAVPFIYSESWVAGTYYITNLIHALNLLDDNLKPVLFILSKEAKDFNFLNEKTGYPYLKRLPLDIKYSVPERIINKISRTIKGANLIQKEYGDKDIDIVFPYSAYYTISKVTNRLHWIPDFQDRYYPEFFSKEEVASRTKYYDFLATTKSHIVFSSENSRDDFNKFYPENKCILHILHFASTHPEYKMMDVVALKKKYDISGDYFISPNQFWKHKNHMVVLKAIKLLKERNLDFKVAFTGKEQDYRNPDYFDQLKTYVVENNLLEYVKFLGFIPREDQLKLMSSALAVIQPSLFEGWSTVVEDAKEMNQYVLLSDIGVHHEQLNYNVSFFDPKNENDLADKMTQVLDKKVNRSQRDYGLNVQKFGSDFVKIVRDVVRPS